MKFEKTLYEKVQELEKSISDGLVFDLDKKFASIYESIDEYKKESDAHVDVLVEEIDCITKASKKLAK